MQPKQSNFFMFILMMGAIFLQFVLASIIIFVQTVNPNFSLGDVAPLWVMILLSQVLIFGVPCAIYLIINRDKIKELLPLRPLGWTNVIMVIGLALTIQPIVMLLNIISQLVFPSIVPEMLSDIGQQSGFLLAIAIVAIVPSIFEEVAFRGIGFAGYGHVKIRTAALINGLIFGMIHFNMNQFIYAFVLGAVFTYFMHYTKSLWAPALAHFVVNGGQATMLAIATIAMPDDAVEAATSFDIAAGGVETVALILTMGVFGLVSFGFFILMYIAFKRHNIRRNQAAGIITNTHAAHIENGHTAPKAFTWHLWPPTIVFALMMILAYVVFPIMENALPQYYAL